MIDVAIDWIRSRQRSRSSQEVLKRTEAPTVCIKVYVLAGEPVAGDDGGGVDFLLNQFVGVFQQLSGQDHLPSHVVTYGCLLTP